MPIKKFQHYVPQFYLKSFSFSQKIPYPVYCFDKASETNFISRISKICGKSFFHDNGENYSNSVENTLSKLENKFSTSYNKIIRNSDLKSLDKSDKTYIATFFLIQWFRTRETRERLRDYNQQLLNYMCNKGELSTRIKKQLDITDDYTKDIHINLFKEIPDLIPYVLNMKMDIDVE